MSARTLCFVIPGDLETKTGGYEYNRHIIAGLRRRAWDVQVVSLPGSYPWLTVDGRATAADALAAIPDRATVLVDGLAYGVLPVEAAREQPRLVLLALVHHPLGLETGLDEAGSTSLLSSEREALSVSRGVVVTSPRTVGAVESLGVQRDRIAVVEPGTDRRPVAAGSAGGALHMVSVASLVPRKGHDTLFDALTRLTHLPWHLTLVGSLQRDSTWAAALVRRAADGPLAGRITIAGELTDVALDAVYHAADLFVLPTRYEGYGMAVAEALARGVPVISTPTGAIAELVGDEAGVLVPPSDAGLLARVLEDVLRDAARLERLRSGALRVRESLPTWDMACARMEEAIVRFAAR